jgi:hypothetical protein
MNTLPFQPVTAERTIKEAQRYREAKDLLKTLSKHLPVPVRLNHWIEIDKEMNGEPLDKLPAIFQRVIRYQLPWVLGILPSPAIKPREVITNALRETPLWRVLAKALQNPDDQPAVVLFHLSHCDVWVAHTTGAPTSGSYVCVPAQVTGKSNITIEPLSQWAERVFDE